MKKLIVCLLVMCSLQAFADKKYNALFSSAVKADSLDRAAEILKDWELNGPKDGDYYAAHYNLRFNKAIAVGIGQSDVRPLYAQDAMVMTDTAGNVAGYMFQKIAVTDYVMLDSAFAWLNKGIALFKKALKCSPDDELILQLSLKFFPLICRHAKTRTRHSII